MQLAIYAYISVYAYIEYRKDKKHLTEPGYTGYAVDKQLTREYILYLQKRDKNPQNYSPYMYIYLYMYIWE